MRAGSSSKSAGRVAHWGELDTPRFRLSYDFDDRKKVESWGTEAILNALVLAGDDRRGGLAAPSDATRQALRHLWSTQHKDGKESGSWDWLDFGLRPWEAGEATYYGTTLAAIAIGTAPGYLKTDHDADTRAGVERLRKYLSSHLEKQNLHNQLFALWASTSIVGVLTDAQRQQIIDQVVARQQENGGWSLSSLVDCKRQDGTPQEKAPDGYATGLALHVLQIAGVGPRQARRRARSGVAPRQPAAVGKLGRRLAQQASRSQDPRRQVHVGRGDRLRDPGPGRPLRRRHGRARRFALPVRFRLSGDVVGHDERRPVGPGQELIRLRVTDERLRWPRRRSACGPGDS